MLNLRYFVFENVFSYNLINFFKSYVITYRLDCCLMQHFIFFRILTF